MALLKVNHLLILCKWFISKSLWLLEKDPEGLGQIIPFTNSWFTLVNDHQQTLFFTNLDLKKLFVKNGLTQSLVMNDKAIK